MDRLQLIDHIERQGSEIKAVLQGLETEHLITIADWYNTQPRQLAEYPLKISGEEKPFNVYIIEWDDGSAYVGYTHQSIVGRMKQHFKNIHIGVANYDFTKRYQAGIGYGFRCLHTNLDKHDAEALEIIEIQNRNNLVNIVHNQNPLHDDDDDENSAVAMFRDKAELAERGAVARYFYGKGKR